MTAPQPAALSEADEKTFISLGNILGIFGFIPSLIVFLVFKERSDRVDRNMKSALNFQLTLVLADVIGFITIVAGIGILLMLAAWVLRLIFSILAFVKTSEGSDYAYPLAISFIK
jgi:uncharacterized Tic20 family protein